MQDKRYGELTKWLDKVSGQPVLAVQALPVDASFRRYFRVHLSDESLVAMDAPPEKEDSHSFVVVADLFDRAGLHVPKIYAKDLTQGFLLLDDFGDDLFLNKLSTANADSFYNKAIHDLIPLQQCACGILPPFDKTLYMFELDNFLHWYVSIHLGLKLTDIECAMFKRVFDLMCDSALQQPQVCVHRDYHSRNLMVLPCGDIGIIDFQDAVKGAVTYDLVSLIRDCYVDWPKSQVLDWARQYFDLALANGIFAPVDFDVFIRWFDWMGMQRHLKATFIFARKFHRDNDPNYLDNIPRALHYVYDVCGHYPELKDLKQFLEHNCRA